MEWSGAEPIHPAASPARLPLGLACQPPRMPGARDAAIATTVAERADGQQKPKLATLEVTVDGWVGWETKTVKLDTQVASRWLA